MDISTYGNNLSLSEQWDGNPESLVGRDNPNQEGGMMASLDDYAKLLSMHLNDGLCGDNRVLSPQGVAFMREARTENPEDGSGYGMGWWLEPRGERGAVTLFTDGGFYGSMSWIDTERNYAGVVFFEAYSDNLSSAGSGSIGSGGVRSQLIPIIEAAFDAVR